MNYIGRLLVKVILYSFVGWFGAHAYQYAYQELYHADLGITAHVVYDRHEDIPGIKRVNKALINGFRALDKKAEEPIKLFWELDTNYWHGYAHAATGHCMIPVGMELSNKMQHAISFVEADTLRHSEPLVSYADFLCKQWYQADDDSCSLDEVLSTSSMQELKEALNSARNFLDQIDENGGEFPAAAIDDIEYDAARNYAQKTWDGMRKRTRKLCNACANKKHKSDYVRAIKELKEDLFTGIADLEFFTKFWTSPASCQIMFAGGDHCNTMVATLKKLGFEEVMRCGVEQHDVGIVPDVLETKKLFSLLQA